MPALRFGYSPFARRRGRQSSRGMLVRGGTAQGGGAVAAEKEAYRNMIKTALMGGLNSPTAAAAMASRGGGGGFSTQASSGM